QDFPFRIRDALRLGFIGYLFNFVAPGAVGGDLVKASLIAREQSSRRLVAAATVIIDRVVGLLALLVVAGFAVLVPTPLVEVALFQTAMGLFWIGSGVGLVGCAALLHPAVPRWRLWRRLAAIPVVGVAIGEMIAALVVYQSRRRVLVAAFGLSLVGHLLLLSGFYAAALALHGQGHVPSYVEHLQLVPAAEVVGVAVPLPAGTGALEGAVAELYALAGSTRGAGLLTALAYRVVTILLAIIGAGYWLSARRDIDRALHEPLPPVADSFATVEPQGDSGVY
ncbi:MAG: flippase-like domain-containing protein, partial [Planctomycetes bacterium]|nr:flippase-like domain-containing protein [Planctomycetota bacterium]